MPAINQLLIPGSALSWHTRWPGRKGSLTDGEVPVGFLKPPLVQPR